MVWLRQKERGIPLFCLDFAVIQADSAAEATGEAEAVAVVPSPPAHHPGLTRSTC